MIEEEIRDGDYIIVEGGNPPTRGETVVALVNGEATVKKFYRERDGRIRLEPANVTIATNLRRERKTCRCAAGGRIDAPLPLNAAQRWTVVVPVRGRPRLPAGPLEGRRALNLGNYKYCAAAAE